MQRFVAILEDNEQRLVEMQACIAELLPQFEHAFFDNAFEMVAWLKIHLPRVVLISLDNDLPVEGDHGTGRQVADFLAGQIPICPVIVHTSNEFFAPGMMQVLADASWPIARVCPHSDHNWIRGGWSDRIREYIKSGWIFE